MLGGGGPFGVEGALEGNRRLEEAVEDLRVKYAHLEAQAEAEKAAKERLEARAAAAEARAIGATEEFDFSAGMMTDAPVAGTAGAGADGATASASSAASGDGSSDNKADEEAKAAGDAGEDDDLDELSRLRAARLAELRKRKEAASRTGGECREISQDDFLPQVTGNKTAVCIFTHKEFKERCDVMIKHARDAAQLLPSTKFLILDADRSPFFVQKLGIRVIPTSVFFIDGKTTTRMLGFDGLTTTADSDNFSLSSVSLLHPPHCALHQVCVVSLSASCGCACGCLECLCSFFAGCCDPESRTRTSTAQRLYGLASTRTTCLVTREAKMMTTPEISLTDRAQSRPAAPDAVITWCQ